MLLDEYERWTGDVELVRQLEPAARNALRWIDEYGDRIGNGYVSYKRREETGLDNQCWKDSWNSILFRDGTLSKLPRACCEIQGYAYDAKMRCARLARKFWNDPALADRLEREAASLKARFNRDFWMPDRECYALAIDGDLRQVDSITSNIGHLLWSGIVDDDKAPHVVRHLMGPKLFSGWGIRTMAEGEGGYNPIGYHVGTVWPHDNSLIAWGLNRYGYREESSTIASGILQAAKFFNYRLAGSVRRVSPRGRRTSRSSTRPRAARRHGRRARRCSFSGRCSASNPGAIASPWTRRSRPTSSGSRSAASPAAGESPTPSDVGRRLRRRRPASRPPQWRRSRESTGRRGDGKKSRFKIRK